MKKLQRIIARCGAMATAAMAVPVVASAQLKTALNRVQIIEKGATGQIASEDSLPMFIGNLIKVAMGFLGIVLLGYLLYAGFLWMTSGGESEKADQAKTMIRNAIIGLVIIVASYAISSFVINALITATV